MPRKETGDRPDFRRKRPQPPNWWQRMLVAACILAVVAGTFWLTAQP